MNKQIDSHSLMDPRYFPKVSAVPAFQKRSPGSKLVIATLRMRESILKTIEYLDKNKWVFEENE